MLQAITPADMKRAEQQMMQRTGTPSLALMERAATHVADAAQALLPQSARLLCVCGAGNNGGDGLAAARILLKRLPRLRVLVWQLAGEPSAETAEQRRLLLPYADRVESLALTDGAPCVPSDVGCIIDAMFGTGLSRPMAGAASAAAVRVNASGCPVVAVDIPSGLDGRTGNALGVAVRADVTVTFHRAKLGLLLGDGLDLVGKLVVGDIGIGEDDRAGYALLQAGDRLLPPRRRNTHKGTYGRVLCVGGSFGMAGAAAICATAALQTGAGLVTVACPKEIVPTVQALCPCATCLPLNGDFSALLPALEACDALVAGCGLGQSRAAVELTDALLRWLCEHDKPAVLDADALNALSSYASRHAGDSPRFGDAVLLTPHPAEAARLLGVSTAEVVADAPAALQALRERYGCGVVLKGAAELLISFDGMAVSPFGTAAMAKGGSGDALSGVLGALLAGKAAYGLQGVRLLQTGCALHGLAGVRAAERCGMRGSTAMELCAELGLVPDVLPDDGSILEAPLPTVDEAAGASGENGVRTPLGRKVRVTVDRPVGMRHPDFQQTVYRLNYGYVADVLAADNEWQDAYVWGERLPVEQFEGEVVAVIHRLNDSEDKWVVAAEGTRVTEAEVREQTAFAEKHFESVVVVL